jgi:hypothetical protein
VYGKDVPASSGPLPAGHEVRGGEVIVRFTHADGGLKAGDEGLLGFTVAGADRQWHPAKASIEGATVIVSSAGVAQPVAVRYGWENSSRPATCATGRACQPRRFVPTTGEPSCGTSGAPSEAPGTNG